MARLLIFGAGASRNYTQGTHGIKELQMPLDSDFFSMAKKVILSEPNNIIYPLSLDIDHLLRDLWELFKNKKLPSDKQLEGLLSKKARKSPNEKYSPEKDFKILEDKRLSLEHIMSMFYEYTVFDDSHYERFQGISKNRLNTLFEIIAYTIMMAQKGPICNKHLKIAKNLNKDDIIISFNYDTILDNALRKTLKLTDLGYKIDFSKVLSKNQWITAGPQNSDVTLLKLHGSLNWLRCKRCRLNFLIRTKIEIKTRSEMWNYLHPKCIRCGTDTVEIVLIPPLIGKNYHEAGLDYLWSDAYNIINRRKKDVEEIIVIGYSLPKADVASTLLFRKINHSIISENSNYKLTIVNPDKSIVDHFGGIFTTSNISHYDSIPHFTDTLA